MRCSVGNEASGLRSFPIEIKRRALQIQEFHLLLFSFFFSFSLWIHSLFSVRRLFWPAASTGSSAFLEIETAEKVPDFVDTFYNLVTDIYEWGWGQSFHFSPAVPGKSHRDATRLHEEMAVDLIDVKPGDRILDVGCGVGGPMRAIAAHSRANVVGITINEYQVNRARLHNRKAGLDSLCEVVCGNFLQMPFADNSFDGAYSIEATSRTRGCHSRHRERIAYWRNHILIMIFAALGIAPKGTVDVHEMLFKTADYLTRGGESGIFTPMHMILCRKPESSEHD
ncbi:unnamed protein product, partial [Vitis vinifera]